MADGLFLHKASAMSTYEQQLLKEKVRFEALFQYASMGILVANERAEITMVNEHLLFQFGYSHSEELMGKKIEALIPSRFHSSHVPQRNQFIESPRHRHMGQGLDLFGLHHNGTEFPVEISLSHYAIDGEKFVIAFVIDISKRKATEDAVLQQRHELAVINKRIEQFNIELEQQVAQRTTQLQEAMMQLEQSKEELTKALSKEKELSDLKTRFVSMASHEFRTPLSTILSSASLLSKYTLEDEQEKRDKHINRIKSAVNNLTDILNEFLSLGRLEDGKIAAHCTRMNIYEHLQSICNDVRGIIKPGQDIQYRHSGSEWVWLDPTLLKNILFNLLSNATKFSPDNGVISVTTRVDENGVMVQVADQGIGIAEEDQLHLFERFFRGANVVNIQGTGLGLHIVEKYVELMDGVIECKSELEKGTIFTIHFPPGNEG